MQKRDSILKSLSKVSDPCESASLISEFRKLRNEITTEKRKSKKLYYETFFEANKLKTSKIWEGIRALVNISTSKATSVVFVVPK